MAYAKHAGKFELDAADGSTLTDYTSEVTDFKGNESVNTGSFHTLGSVYERATQGGHVIDYTVEFLFDIATASLANVVRLWLAAGGAKTMTVSDPDDSVGSFEYTQEVVCTGVNPQLDLMGGSGDPQKQKMTLKPNGDLTTAIIST